MSVRVTTEEAREYVASRLDGYETPRMLRFPDMGNHLASAIILAACGEEGQRHDIGFYYTSFRVICPKSFERKSPRDQLWLTALEDFEGYEWGARERLREGVSDTILDGLDWETGAKWKFDDWPVDIFAVNSLGVAAKVSHMGGFVELSDKNWHHVQASIVHGIQEQFEHP